MGDFSKIEDETKRFGRKLDDEVFQPVADVGSKIDDEILQPVKNTVEAIVEDPKKLAAVAIAVAFPGAGAALGAQLGLSGAVAQVVGQTIINTVTNGGDVKAAVIGAALPIVGQEISQTIGTALTNSNITGTVNTIITDVATRGLTAAAIGQDPLAAMALGGVTAGVTAIAGQIPGFTDLHPSAQSAIQNAVATQLLGGDVSQSLVNSAINFATKEFAAYSNRGGALKRLAESGLDFGQDYSQLSEEQKAVVDAIAKAPSGNSFFGPVPPGDTQEKLIAEYKDYLYTDESEARDLAKNILGREPTEFELLEFIGIPESSTKSLLDNIRYDESTFDSDELAQSYKAVYGKEPTAEWLASDEAMDMLGRSEAQGQNLLNEFYTKDKNWVTEDEAQQFWKDAGNTGAIPQGLLDNILLASENSAKANFETYRIAKEDIEATTFDGSQYATPQEASAAAKAAGFNAFTHKDKNLTYFTQPSPVEEANIRADVEEKKTFNEAFAAARKELGAGKTFTWNGKQYTTNVLPNDTFDASKSSTVTTAATLAYANGKDKFIGPDGKTYLLDDAAKSVLASSVNQSEAETQRLLRQAIKPATNETAAETQRLMESGTRGTMDVIGAMAAQTLGTTQRGLGSFLSNAGKTYAAITGDLDFDNALIKIGKEVESYAQGNDIYGLDVQKNRLSQAMARANETDDWIEKTKILGSAIGKNSLGFFDVAGSEVVEELPETILQIGAALMTGGASLGAIGAIGAAGSVMETFGSTVEDTYKQAKKAGLSDSEAVNKAYLNGVLSTAIEAGTNYVADKALLAPFLNKFTGTLAGTATGFVSSTTIGAASELAAGLSQSYATQYIINPETASLSKAATDGIFEMFIGGTAQGTMGLPGYAIQGGTIIGKDYFGKDVTMADVAAGAALDSSTVNPNATIATSEEGNPVTLGGAMLQMPNYQFDMSTLKTYVPQVFNNDNLIVGKDELGNAVTFGDLMGQTTESKGIDVVYKDLIGLTPQQKAEAQKPVIEQALKDAGLITYSAADIESLINSDPSGTSAIIASAQDYANPRVTTEDEAVQMLERAGYTNPTADEVAKFIGSISEAESANNIAEYVAPRLVTEGDAKAFFESQGYQPTKEEIAQFIRQGADVVKDNVQQELNQYVDVRQVTQSEVENFFKDFGYTPSPEEIASYVRQGLDINQDLIKSELGAYIDPRMVTEQEVRDAYAELGLSDPTQADINKLIGQYEQEALAGRAQENLDTAQFNVTTAKQEEAAKALADLDAKTTEQYDALTAAQKAAADALVAQGQTLQDAITAAKTETAGQIADVETRLTDAIAAAEAMGLSRDQAITAAVDSVAAELGTTKESLLTQLGTTEDALRTEFATGITGLETQMQEQYNALTAEQKALADALTAQGTTLADAIATAKSETAGQISELEAATKAQYDALTAEQKALADALTAQGTTLADAIAVAQEQTQTQIGELTADVQAKFDALTEEQKALATSLQQQGVDLNTAIETAQQQTQQQIADLGTQVDTRINELMQQGQTYQQATQQAFAEVNAKNQELSGLIGTQGRTASQQDIDALNQMLGGQRSMDLAYDVTGDKQITQADIDFLTQVVGGTKTDWTAPQQSPWAATGLYGQIQANEQRRQQDLAAAEAQRQAEQQAAAQAAAERDRQANIRTTATRAQTSAQGIMQQLESMQRAGMTPQPTPLVESSAGFDLSNPLNTGFFSGFQTKKTQQNQQPTTKIAAGGYIDDLLAEGMTVDDLLNLLR